MTNDLFLKIKYTTEFKKELKRLGKKYRSIKSDVQGFIDSIKPDSFPGDVMQGIQIEEPIYKARVKNSDNKKGKSGGYRIIYGYFESETILLIQIYSKSDQPDTTPGEINDRIMQHEQKDETEDE